MFGQWCVPLPWDGVVVVDPVLGVVVDPEFVVVPGLVELEPAAFAIAAPPPAMIPTAPSVSRAIRSRFMASPPLTSCSPPARKDGTPKRGLRWI
jgi:hypothetical protein